MSIYTIQGQDVEFDPFDVEAYERYESQLEQMRKIKEEIPTGSAAAGMRFLCHAVMNFFDDVAGEGTAQHLFGERTNLKDCFDAFYAFTEAVSGEIKGYTETTSLPIDAALAGNRAQRRAAERKK